MGGFFSDGSGHFLGDLFFDGNTQFRLKKLASRNGPGCYVLNENSGHTASTTLKLGGEYSQSSGAYSVEGLTSSRAM